MRVLLVKTSSLGDLIHTLPALTDAAAAIPGIRFDWVVEEAFAEVPAWHPAVERVIPVAMRRWRHALWACWREGEWRRFRNSLRERSYDAVIDAQGLVKSACIARQAQGPRFGLDRNSAREPLAALVYHHPLAVPRDQHAIERVRQLFAQALGYGVPEVAPDFGLKNLGQKNRTDEPYLVFLHGTTWPSKHWPERYWEALAALAGEQGLAVQLPWGNAEEQARAERLAEAVSNVRVLPRMGLSELASELVNAAGVVGVDSGLSHLAAAVGVPGVTLYGATRSDLTGVIGPHNRNLVADFACAPCLRRTCNYTGHSNIQPACFQTLPPDRVWRALRGQMEEVRA